ncbi:MAG TPA: LemA family protein [Candidatus Paceibacterota bacterium]
MKKIVIGIVIVVVLALIYTWSTYNRLVTLNIAADTQWKQVETNYQRRFDLIPNLVESVKGAMKQEQAIFGELAAARTKYSGATTPNAKAAAAGEVETALGRLLAVVENYPVLRSTDTVQTLMSQLEGTENRISVERMRFNQTIQAYNIKTMRFPSAVVANIFGFNEREYFNSTPGAENAPKVSL